MAGPPEAHRCIEHEREGIRPVSFLSFESHMFPKIGKQVTQDALRQNSLGHLITIADGMGGPKAAAAASLRVVMLIEEASRTDPRSLVEAQRYQEIAYRNAHRRIQDEYPGTGTTATSISLWELANKKLGLLTWVGDTRAYLIRANTITRLTQDQDSVTMKLPQADIPVILDEVDAITTREELGQVSERAQEVWKMRKWKMEPNHLGGYLNPREGPLYLQTVAVPLLSGDKLLLTTDGLSDNLTTGEILANSSTAEKIANAAYKYANPLSENFRATEDDITVGMATVG